MFSVRSADAVTVWAAKLMRLNGKLYTVEKSLREKSCPAVANGLTGSVVR